MKGEYVEEKDRTTNMFAKLHQTHKFPHHHHQPPPHLSSHHHHHQPPQPITHFHLTADPHTSSSADSPTSDKKDPPTTTDGASIEVTRRPRGRPPGSKNKPKPPVILTREPEPAMNPYVLELPGGSDIINSVTRFVRKRNTGIIVLTGSGTVTNVTLRQPTTTPPPASTVTFHGRFDILSISGTVLPAMTHPFANGFTISLSGPSGQIVGGPVVGPLLTAGTVYIIAASFNNPSYHRLQAEEVGNEGSGAGESPAAADSGGVSIYSQMGTDVIWAPTARPPAF